MPPQVLPGTICHDIDDLDTSPQKLLVNAVRHKKPGRARLVEMLLQRGPPPLEQARRKSGETALSLAACYNDAEVRFAVHFEMHL
jgi:hypothetical protein